MQNSEQMDDFGNGFIALIAEATTSPYRCPIDTTAGARFLIDGMPQATFNLDDAGLRLFGLIA